MPLYFPSLLHHVDESVPRLNDPSILRQFSDAYVGLPSAYVANYLLETFYETSLGPVGWVAAAIQTALYLVSLFNQPTRIDVQKDAVEQYFDPLTHFVELNYCYPINGQYFKVMESNEVQDVFDRRPDLDALRETMYSQARDLIEAGIGLEGYGHDMNKRIVNQCLANWERHGWSTAQVIDCWQGICNAGEVGPQPNGVPPPGTAMSNAFAGMQVGAGLYHKWDSATQFLPEDWQMFSDYYVQQGWDMESARSGHPGVFWDQPWQYWGKIGQPPVPVPQTQNFPQQDSWFSPPCRQTLIIPPPQPPPVEPPSQPTQDELDYACALWIAYRSTGDLDPEDWAWIATPRGKAAAEATRNDPRCYPAPQPPPPPGDQPELPPRQDELDYACFLWIMYRTFGTLADEDWAWIATPRGKAAAEATRNDPRCYPAPQPPPPPPAPQPPTQTPYQKACTIWLKMRSGQDLTPEEIAWMVDPAHYSALQEAMCDPQCGYVPPICQPQPPPCQQQCPPGPPGQQGRPGQPGQPGRPGPAGPAGRTGQPGQTGPAGRTGQPGQTGPAGRTGQPGQTGPAGRTGPAGPAGSRGKDGTRARPERNLDCFNMGFCDLGIFAWGIMADCWLETYTEHRTFEDSMWAGKQFPQYVQDQYSLLTNKQSSGDFRTVCEYGHKAFWSLVKGSERAFPLVEHVAPYRGWVYVAPEERTGGLRFPIVKPHPDELDPCGFTEGIGNG